MRHSWILRGQTWSSMFWMSFTHMRTDAGCGLSKQCTKPHPTREPSLSPWGFVAAIVKVSVHTGGIRCAAIVWLEADATYSDLLFPAYPFLCWNHWGSPIWRDKSKLQTCGLPRKSDYPCFGGSCHSVFHDAVGGRIAA